MAEASIGEIFRIAVQHHQAGRLAQAETLYRQILDRQPNHADTLHLLGVMAGQVNRNDIAVQLLGRAIAINPGVAEYHSNLCFTLQKLERWQESIACGQRAVALNPEHADAQNNLGIAMRAMRRLEEAVACHRKAVALKPHFAEAHGNLGDALNEKGQLDQAIACYQRAVALKPDFAEVYNNLANALKDKGQLDEAMACYQKALTLKPDFAEVHYNLGNALKDKGPLDEAMACYQRALTLKPDYAEAHNNLGNALKDKGQLDEAMACYQRALAIKPDWAGAHSNLVYTLHFHPSYDVAAIFHAHRRWNEQHARPLQKLILPHPNVPDPDRRLRLGYVSPNLYRHVVGQFLLPLLANHDHSALEIFCYSDVRRPDELTEQLRRHADTWRNIVGQTDQQVADLVRQDRIDILVDLTMQMDSNRLLVFARKPAPVQVTYLAYCSTTGLETIDYRLTDPQLDPPGLNDAFYSEKSIRLPETYWCYQPATITPEVNALPASSAGHITFGSLNNFAKVNPATLSAWRQLLRQVPNSHLLLHANEGSHRQTVLDFLARDGVDPARLEFVGHLPAPQYFQLYSRIDMALDPFPYGGGTTTCDALWMGVPVISLAGQTAVSRGGLTILTNVGLTELVAGSSEQYVKIAADLAGDLPRLAALRAGLRQRMRQSPLMDGPRFARNVESAYREIWRRWCDQREAGPHH